MKKFLYPLILLLFFVLISFTIILSTIGVETDRFNNLIIKKINQTNSNINLKLSTIKFKLDVKEISLFIETINPQINYRKVDVPAKKIKVYINFSILPSNTLIGLVFSVLFLKSLTN